MIKATKTLPLGEGGTKNIVVYTSEDCEPDTLYCTQQLAEMLRMVADQPSLTYCKNKMFDKLTLSHNGERWVLQTENVTYEQ